MISKSQTAWETAARCAALAQEAEHDPEAREYYVRMRDAWTTLAKRCEDLNISDVTEK
jgi:pterin-4a-carbinolamine dehydratase